MVKILLCIKEGGNEYLGKEGEGIAFVFGFFFGFCWFCFLLDIFF